MENLEDGDNIAPVELTDRPTKRKRLNTRRTRIALVGNIAVIAGSIGIAQLIPTSNAGVGAGTEPDTETSEPTEVTEPEPVTCWSDDIRYGFEEWQVMFPGYECITEPDPCAGQPATPNYIPA